MTILILLTLVGLVAGGYIWGRYGADMEGRR